MFRFLAEHTFKRIRRSPDFHKNVVANTFIGLMFSILFLDILFLGLYLDKILASAEPGKNPVEVLNGLLLFYFSADLLVRFLVQKVHTISAKPYLLLSVPRSSLLHFLLAKSVLSWFNFVPLLLFIPGVFTVVGKVYSPAAASAWLAAIMLLMLTNSFINTYLKNRLLSNAKTTGAIVAVIAVLVGLEYAHVLSPASVSRAVFGFILQQPAAVILCGAALAGMYVLNYRFLAANLYLDKIHSSQKSYSTREVLPFLSSFGVIGSLIAFEVKMLVRNRRPRALVMISAMMIFYGLLVYPSARHEVSDVMKIFISLMCVGLFTMTYGSFMFSWESSYFGFVTTRNIRPRTYILAKYLLMTAAATLAVALSSFYAYFGLRIVMVQAMVYLFNLGIVAPFMLYAATFNRLPYDLSASTFSQQGKMGMHYSIAFVVIILHLAVYLPVRFLFSSDAGCVALGAAGLAGILASRWWLPFIAAQFTARKHRMVAGFRHA